MFCADGQNLHFLFGVQLYLSGRLAGPVDAEFGCGLPFSGKSFTPNPVIQSSNGDTSISKRPLKVYIMHGLRCRPSNVAAEDTRSSA